QGISLALVTLITLITLATILTPIHVVTSVPLSAGVTMTSTAAAVLHVEEKAEAWTCVQVDGLEYRRQPVRTRWLTEADGLVTPLKDHLDMLRPGDTVAVSEKVVVLLTGRAVDIATVHPGPLARALAGKVRPGTGSGVLSAPWHA